MHCHLLLKSCRLHCPFAAADACVSSVVDTPAFPPPSPHKHTCVPHPQQAVARRVAYQTFSHVLELDITFHMNRRTGRLSRILERGTRSIQMLYRAVLFTFAPTFIELIFVVGLLASRFSPMVAALVGCTFALYVAWTLSMTQVGWWWWGGCVDAGRVTQAMVQVIPAISVRCSNMLCSRFPHVLCALCCVGSACCVMPCCAVLPSACVSQKQTNKQTNTHAGCC